MGGTWWIQDCPSKRNCSRPHEDPWVRHGRFLQLFKIPNLLLRETMADFFSKSIANIKQGLDIAFENGQQLADVRRMKYILCDKGLTVLQKVILVGGLASSPYVYAELQKWGTENGVSVSRPDGPT